MKKIFLLLLLIPTITLGACMDFYKQNLVTLQGKKFDLCEYQDKPIIFVNTASKCGFTSQFEGLEKLYRENKDNYLLLVFRRMTLIRSYPQIRKFKIFVS